MRVVQEPSSSRGLKIKSVSIQPELEFRRFPPYRFMRTRNAKNSIGVKGTTKMLRLASALQSWPSCWVVFKNLRKDSLERFSHWLETEDRTAFGSDHIHGYLAYLLTA